jgi:hypothetical protein
MAGKKVKVSIQPTPEAKAKLEKAAKDLAKAAQSQVSRAVGFSVLAIDRGAKRRCPVDTGRLRSGFEIDWKAGEVTGKIYNQVQYATDVEFGVGGRSGVFMLTNAVNEELPNFKKNVEKALKKLK